MAAIREYHSSPPTQVWLSAALTDALDSETAEALVAIAMRKASRGSLATTEDVILAAEILIDLGDRVRFAARSQKVRAIMHRALHMAV